MAKKINKKKTAGLDWGVLLPVQFETPEKMLQEYFESFDLKICKQVMWIYLRETMTGEYVDTMSRNDRDRIFHFYAYTISLLEALHTKHHKRKRNKKKSTG